MIGLLKLTKIIYSLFLYYEKHRGAAIAAGVEPPESVHPSAYAGAVQFFGISNIGTHRPLRGRTFLKHAPFLTGSSVGSPLTPSGNAPQTDSSASANGKLPYRYPKSSVHLGLLSEGAQKEPSPLCPSIHWIDYAPLFAEPVHYFHYLKGFLMWHVG